MPSMREREREREITLFSSKLVELVVAAGRRLAAPVAARSIKSSCTPGCELPSVSSHCSTLEMGPVGLYMVLKSLYAGPSCIFRQLDELFVVGFDSELFMAIVEDGRRNRVPVKLRPTQKCLELQKFQMCIFNGIIMRTFEDQDERCLQVFNFTQVEPTLNLRDFEHVQALRRGIQQECSRVHPKVVNEVLLELKDCQEFLGDDWNECLNAAVNRKAASKACPGGDCIPIEDFVCGRCDDPRMKRLTPLPALYEDIVREVFVQLGEELYRSAKVRRILDSLLE
ncbi:uncharacterized protein LOC144178282 isoform X1 [Haemaphysalis longicornis]